MDDTQIEMLPMLGEFSSIASQYEHIMFYYESGIQQIVAKLQILNNEFKNNHERNPIENIKSRVKSLDSIIDKMKRKGIPLIPLKHKTNPFLLRSFKTFNLQRK